MSSTSKEKPPTHTKMNSTNLYVTTTQIILNSDPANPNSWQDLYRLIPYLRNSLCCVVCSNLLVEPLTPSRAQCQHHLCKKCRGGRKKIKPACESCKDCRDYTENRSLKILMQMYKKMCVNLINSPIFKCIMTQACQPGTGFERGATNLIQLIREGALFEDDYKSEGGLPKSTYSILPCIYMNSVCPQNIQTAQNQQQQNPQSSNNSLPNKSHMYSVLYPGTGNKITIKRKPKESNIVKSFTNTATNRHKDLTEKGLFKKPCAKPKKGCRCGNATATPGKLTCCGQRCPCYVESKACIDCRCRGCRNPHRPDGNKVMAYVPELDNTNLMMPCIPDLQLQQIQILPGMTTTTPQVVPIVRQPQEAVDGVKLENIELNTPQFFATQESLDQQFKAYKLLTGFDAMHTLTDPDLVHYGFNGEDDDEITVV